MLDEEPLDIDNERVETPETHIVLTMHELDQEVAPEKGNRGVQLVALREDLGQAQFGLTVPSGGQPFIHPEVLDTWNAAARIQGQSMRLHLATPFGGPFVENLRIITDGHYRSLLLGGSRV